MLVCVMRNTDVMAVARAAIEEFGPGAVAAMEKRADAHRLAGEREGALFWRRVADVIRQIQGDTGS